MGKINWTRVILGGLVAWLHTRFQPGQPNN